MCFFSMSKIFLFFASTVDQIHIDIVLLTIVRLRFGLIFMIFDIIFACY